MKKKYFGIIAMSLVVASVVAVYSHVSSFEFGSQNAWFDQWETAETTLIHDHAVNGHSRLAMLARETGVPILTYHDLSGIPHDPWSLSPKQFADEMAYLHDKGYHVIPLSELYQKLFTSKHVPLPSKPIVITFDDGYESNYSVAYPILKQYSFHATVFMVSSFAGKRDFMTWAQLRQMQVSGLVDIESHTVNHAHLAKLSHFQVQYQLVESKKALESQLHQPIQFFCYPFNSYNASVISQVRAAGYKMAVTDNFGLASLFQSAYTVDRVEVLSTLSMAQFAMAITGRERGVTSRHVVTKV